MADMIRTQMLTKSFRASEFKCRCRRPECDAPDMKPSFMALLQHLREEWGKPISPTSGSRCAYWNKLQGGVSDSQHLIGNAADFWFVDSNELDSFYALAEKCGFGGIGSNKHKIHIDARQGYARWTYPD